MSNRLDLQDEITQSKINLVDLAGSEKCHVSGALHVTDSLKEANYINKSLSALSSVMNALSKNKKNKQNRHIPFRHALLTKLLQDSMHGHSKVLMIATVAPNKENLNQTWTTMQFARTVRNVEMNVKLI